VLKKTSAQGVEKHHKEHFVGWFERKVSNVIAYMTKTYCSTPLLKHFRCNFFFS
jgi:hypothetical protein